MPGPHTRILRAERTRAAGPVCTPEGRAIGAGWVPRRRHPSRTHEAAPPLPAFSCHPNSAQRQLARAGALGALTGKDKGQRAPAARLKDGRSRKWECRTPDVPHRGTRRPPRAPSCHPYGATQAPCGLHDPLRPGKKSSAPRLHARRTDGWWRESTPSRRPSTKAPGGPPRGPFCHSHSAHCQLARACAVGSVTGPHTGGPRAQGKREAGLGHTPEGQEVG